MTFKAHYRGSSEVDAIIPLAEGRLDKLVYRGEKPRYTFESHVSFHRRSHNELEMAKGVAMTGPEKVRKLLASIQATSMQVPLATIRASDHLRHDFDEAVNFLRQYIATTAQTDSETRTVAKVNITDTKPEGGRGGGRGGGGRGGGRGGRGGKGRGRGDSKKMDRWYPYREWQTLDEDTKKQILQTRQKRKIAVVEDTETSTRTDPSGGPTQRNEPPAKKQK
jgi:hypothetical protein